MTRAWLQRYTTRYLERYASSESNLRRLLRSKAYRTLEHHDDTLEELTVLIDLELARVKRLGWIDDARFALDRARSLHRRGNSLAKIRAHLRSKGVGQAHTASALEALGSAANRQALFKFAKRRRIGPFRRVRGDDRKELAKFARAGFDFESARTAVNADSIEELEDWVTSER